MKTPGEMRIVDIGPSLGVPQDHMERWPDTLLSQYEDWLRGNRCIECGWTRTNPHAIISACPQCGQAFDGNVFALGIHPANEINDENILAALVYKEKPQ